MNIYKYQLISFFFIFILASVNSYAQLSGPYTIGGILPDYVNFTDAVNDLNTVGVTGAVIFNVRTGTYTEQIIINQITGASITNTITFQSESGDSTDVILTQSIATFGDNYTIKLDGADYITFKSMTISATNGSNNRVIELTNGASFNRFLNNKLMTISGSNGDEVVYSGNSSTNDNDNLFENNWFLNGEYGIYFEGLTAALKPNIIIQDNLFECFRWGIYLKYMENISIIGNTIIHASSYNAAATRGIELYACRYDFEILKNTIIMMDATNSVGMQLMVCDGLGTMGLVANNMVSVGGTGNAHGLYMNGTDDKEFYFNSFYNSGTNESSAKAFYMNGYSDANIIIKNNIFYATTGYAIYNSVGGIVSSDYNDYYTDGTYHLGRWDGVDVDNLSELQTQSGDDANSVSVNPELASAPDLHLNELTTTLIGQGLNIPAITDDIDGDLRPDPPTIGADEPTLVPCDAPILTAKANNVAIITTECSGADISLTANPTGSAGCSGTWDYAWFDGTNYWNGTGFISVAEVWNTSYDNINVINVTVSTTYTAKVRCSDETSCNSESNVIVTIISAPANVTAAIGDPANGLEHYIDISWDTVTGIDGYELQYSTDSLTWSTLYTGTLTSYEHNCGDNPNAPYYYKVRAYKDTSYCNFTDCSNYPIYTACDYPELPLISAVTSNSLDLTLQAETPVVNPPITTYSIYCTTTGQYVQADGTLNILEVFLTKATWGTKTVIGLSLSTEYCFYAKARNNDGDIRFGGGGSVISVIQEFNSDVIVHGVAAPTTVWFAPDFNTPIDYSSSGGCPGGYATYSGSWNSWWGNFLRTPEADCSGQNEVILNFDISHSYFASHPNDRIRFYMWVDGGYEHAVSVKIYGIEKGISDINGLWLYFDEPRNCIPVEVFFDLSVVIDKTNILFYLEGSCGYNDAQIYMLGLDNIEISGAALPACTTTAASCIPPAITLEPISQTVCEGDSVTFIVSATGTVPLDYQWKKNSIDIPLATNNSYTINPVSISDAGNYTCYIINSCGNVTSNIATLTVNAFLPVSISISANPSTTICTGDTVTFTAMPTNGGTTPSYQWQLNGGNVGSDSSTYINSSPTDGDVITCILTSSESCATGNPDTSNALTITVSSGLPVSIIISAYPSTTICIGDTVIFTATPVNEGTSPLYQWQLNGGNAGTDNSTYTNSSLTDGDVITCILTSSESCATGNPDTSNILTITVSSGLPVSVSISANPSTTICTGDTVTFTAMPTNGGTAPSYQWQLNGGNVGTDSSTYTNSLLPDGDIVTCILTSSESCATGNPDTSNALFMTVSSGLPVSVSISANPSTTICTGDTVIFTANPVNEGTTPSYQWQLNGGNAGSDSSTYTNSSLADGDVITCILTSSESCATGNPDTSNILTITVSSGLPVSVSISANPSTIICSGTNITFTATSVNEGITPLYQWLLNGMNVGTNNSTYQDSTLSDSDTLTCELTSSLTCATNNPAISSILIITVYPMPDAEFTFTTDSLTVSFNNLSTNSVNNYWDFGDDSYTVIAVNPEHTYDTAGTYTVQLIAESEDGCKDTTYLDVLVKVEFDAPLVSALIIYNVFTPNGDDVNDTWHIENITQYPNNSVEIYNRNGNLVFSAEPYQNDWDGKYDGKELPAATYYYLINPGDGSEVFKGYVTIIR